MDRLGYIFLGLLLIYLGFEITLDPKVYNPIYDYHFDFTGYNIPLGIAMIILGVAFIWTEVKKKLRK